MGIDNVLQEVSELTSRVLQFTPVTPSIHLTCGNHWSRLVSVNLAQGNERLDSVRTLLKNNYLESVDILTRSLFEIAVNLTYISKDVSGRLPEYLKHGKVPTTKEEAGKLQRELEGLGKSGQLEAAQHIVPHQSWRVVRAMCDDLGQSWLREYTTFYAYTSVSSHAGAFTLSRNYARLLKEQPPSDQEKAAILVTALVFHLRVADIAAWVFPLQIKPETVKKLSSECQKLGKSLV